MNMGPAPSQQQQQIPLGAAPIPSGSNIPGGSAPLSEPRRLQRINFLKTLGQQMVKAGNPLPPALTGDPNQAYDPQKSRFNILDIPAPGYFNLAGKAIDVQDLFLMVVQTFGGSAKVCA